MDIWGNTRQVIVSDRISNEEIAHRFRNIVNGMIDVLRIAKKLQKNFKYILSKAGREM